MKKKKKAEIEEFIKFEIYPSAIFSNDGEYLSFLDEILDQTNQASMNPSISFFIGGNEMMKKKIFHDFLLETKRRFFLAASKYKKK